MDPNATMRRIHEAIADGDRVALIDALEDLLSWLSLDGFMPTPQ